MSAFKVLNPGIMTLVVDNGRVGYSHLGVCQSGASDEYAYHISNMLLKNEFGTNALEISFSGLQLEAMNSFAFSIAGSDLSLSINGIKKSSWRSYLLFKGDIVKFEKKVNGQKAYLSVKGGFALKKELESYSTSIKEKLGTVLKTGDILKVNDDSLDYISSLKKMFIPNYEEDLTLRLIPSYQYNTFSKEAKDKFFNSIFTLSNESNKMGVKLDGVKIESVLDGIISEGIAFGSVQIPKDGRPIVLLKERQTIGGYPKIGTVLSVDCFKLSQIKVGSNIKFELIDINEAQKILKKFYSSFR